MIYLSTVGVQQCWYTMVVMVFLLGTLTDIPALLKRSVVLEEKAAERFQLATAGVWAIKAAEAVKAARALKAAKMKAARGVRAAGAAKAAKVFALVARAPPLVVRSGNR
jgi:hypothetical protein